MNPKSLRIFLALTWMLFKIAQWFWILMSIIIVISHEKLFVKFYLIVIYWAVLTACAGLFYLCHRHAVRTRSLGFAIGCFVSAFIILSGISCVGVVIAALFARYGSV